MKANYLNTIKEALRTVDVSILGYYDKKEYSKLVKYINKEAPYIVETLEDEIILEVIFEGFMDDYKKLAASHEKLAKFHKESKSC